MKARYIVLCSCAVMVAFALTFWIFYPRNPLLSYYHVVTSQKVSTFIDPHSLQHRLLRANQQQASARQFLEMYFKPWHLPRYTHQYEADPLHQLWLNIDADWRSDIQALGLQSLHYFGANLQPYSTAQIQSLLHYANNTNRISQNAIVVRTAYLRVLPTQLPFYLSSQIAGQGYPFDNLQYSSLWIGQPVRIVAQTKDHQWSMVALSSQIGWLSSDTLATVDRAFMKRYSHAHFVAIIRDSRGPQLRIGMILPILRQHVMQPARDPRTHKVLLIPANISQHDYATFPVSATGKHIAELMQQLLGEPYAWGGLNHYRDCSLTVQSLYAALGIWLPRNSVTQSEAGTKINVSGLDDHAKVNAIRQHAIPLMSLLSMPGHIVIYIGEQHQQLYVLQDTWGIKNKGLFGHRGRALIGKTVISPITLGQGTPNVKQSLLQRITRITILKQQ